MNADFLVEFQLFRLGLCAWAFLFVCMGIRYNLAVNITCIITIIIVIVIIILSELLVKTLLRPDESHKKA